MKHLIALAVFISAPAFADGHRPSDGLLDMAAMEAAIRTIQMDGLLWGAAKLIPVAYGVKKLQIMSTVEDEKVLAV